MAELPSDDENELNFSDYENDSDNEKGARAPTTSVIAHKSMKLVDISDAEESEKEDSDHEGSDKDEPHQELEFESISPPQEKLNNHIENNEHEPRVSSTVQNNDSFEPISPVSDHGNNFEAISPPASPPLQSKPQFDNISDEEDDDMDKQEELPEGKFSPPESPDNELNFHDESSNDSGYQIIPKTPVVLKESSLARENTVENLEEGGKDIEEDDSEEKNNEVGEKEVGENKEEGDKNDTEGSVPKPSNIEDIEAPMPSPFSDIGDIDDLEIPEADGQIISDILQDTDATEQKLEKEGAEAAPDKKEKGDIEDGTDKGIDENIYKSNDAATEDGTEKENTNEGEKEYEEHHAISAGENGEAETENESIAANDAGDATGSIQQPDGDRVEEGGEKGATEEGDVGVEKDGDSQEGDGEEKKDEEDEDDAGDLIADIFGDSDEEEEFEGFEDEEPPADDKEESDDEVQPAKTVPVEEEKRDDSSDDEPQMPARDFVNDFDLMLEKKKAERRIQRKRKNVDIISDNDEIIAGMIRQMKEAAEEDRMLNQAGKAATKKLKMLGSVVKSLRKTDLQMTFIDCGVLNGIKEWLTPLPDHALPHIHIRKLLLQILLEFPPLDKSALKQSGIGRAVMLLFKHPKEVRENKHMAGKIISNWARPIFNVSTNFMDMSKEEREERDKKTLHLKGKREESEESVEPKRTKLNKEEDETENKPRRPGDPGWCARARVPQASNRDYVNRPVSKIDSYESTRSLNTKQPKNRYEKHAQKMKGKKGNRTKAMDISLSGSKMGL